MVRLTHVDDPFHVRGLAPPLEAPPPSMVPGVFSFIPHPRFFLPLATLEANTGLHQ